MPKKEDRIVHKLLFELATWHSLVKLQLHTETTVTDLENSATCLGHLLRKFKNDICSVYATRDLPSEEAACGQCKAAKAAKVGKKPETLLVPTGKKKKPKLHEFTMETYKLHGLPDYPAAIHAHGVTENTSTKNVRYL